MAAFSRVDNEGPTSINIADLLNESIDNLRV